MPSQKTVNPSARVRSYPVAERHRFVWVWTGDPADADPATIPDLHWNDDPAWAGDGRLIHVDCNYKLIVDNLMDLTHETFVHGGSIGHRVGGRVAVRGDPRQGHGDRHPLDDRRRGAAVLGAAARVARSAGRQRRPLADHPLHPARDDRHRRRRRPDRHRRARGRPLAGRQRVRAQHDDPGVGHLHALLLGLRAELRAWATSGSPRCCARASRGVFAEDEEVLAAQQRAIDAHPDKEFYNLNIDGGAMWARRMIDLMLAAEDDSYAAAGARPSATSPSTTAPTPATAPSARSRGRGRRPSARGAGREHVTFVGARVRAVRAVADEVRQVELVPDDGARAYPPGSHLDLALEVDGLPVVRSYSVVGAAPEDGAYRIAVKLLPDSRGGSRRVHGLAAGDRLELRHPTSHFELDPRRPGYLLVAGGIGITPLVGMAEVAGPPRRPGAPGLRRAPARRRCRSSTTCAGCSATPSSPRRARTASGSTSPPRSRPAPRRRGLRLRPAAADRRGAGVLGRAGPPGAAAAHRDLRDRRAPPDRGVRRRGPRPRPDRARPARPHAARGAARRRGGDGVGLPARRVRAVHGRRARRATPSSTTATSSSTPTSRRTRRGSAPASRGRSAGASPSTPASAPDAPAVINL